MTDRHRAVLARLPVVITVVVTIVGVLAGCGGPPPPVRVGWGTTPESHLLGEIYATGLEVRGFPVRRMPGVDGVAAVRDGAVDLVPAYTGRLLDTLDPRATATAPDDVYRQAAAALPPTVRLLDRAHAENKDVVVVTLATAARQNLRSLADLAPRCPTVTLGGSADLPPRLDRTYGCRVRAVRPLDPGPPAAAALRDGTVGAAEMSSTDPEVTRTDLTALDDPRSMVTAQNVVPVIAADRNTDPRITGVVNKISSQLDTAVLADLDRRLTGPDRLEPAQVARDWLASAGIG